MNLIDKSLKHPLAGIVITAVNVLLIINAALFFLIIANFPLVGWLCFNICTPSVLLYLAGFLLKRIEIMSASVPFLLFFGGGGLFIFGWSGSMLFAQAGHLAMTVAVAYIIYLVIREKKWINVILSFIVGAVVLAGIFPFQQNYVAGHPELMKKLGDPAFEEFMKNKTER